MGEEKFDKKLKHLEFIQSVITRMNTNSFQIKGWTVTLVAALFALSAASTNQKFYLISFLPIPVFWLLDGFFISTERRFRDLYKEVSEIESDKEIDFKMNPYFNVKLVEAVKDKGLTGKQKFGNWIRLNWNKFIGWLKGTLSITLILFYGATLTILIILKNII